MKKSFLSKALVAVLVVLSIFAMTFVVSAETTNVAKIEKTGVEYATLQAAIDAAEAGDTVTLLKDITLGTYVQGKSDAAVTINKAITLDGNGKTLTSKAGRAINVDVAGDVEIKNLTIKQYCGRNSSDQKRCINVITNTVNLKVTGCTLELVEHYNSGRTLTSYVAGVQAATGSSHTIVIDGCNIKTIYGVVVYATGSDISIKNSAISNALYGAWINTACEINVENSTITTKEDMGTNNLGVGFLVQTTGASVVVDENTTINLPAPKGEDGTQTGGQAFAMYSSAKMADLGTIDLGEATVNKTNTADPVIYLAGAQAQINREDGTVMYDTLEEAIKNLTDEDHLDQLESLDGTEITNESVNEKLEELDRDFYFDEEGEAQPTAVAKIGETPYGTLAEAIEKATAGQTITFLADINENVTINKAIIIDGAGYTFGGTVTLAVPSSDETMTFKNVVFKTQNKNGICLSAASYNVTFDACTFKGAASYTFEIPSGTTANNFKFINECKIDMTSDFMQISGTASDMLVNGMHIVNCGNAFKVNKCANAITFNDVTVDNAYIFIYGMGYSDMSFVINDCDITATFPFVRQDRAVMTYTYTFTGENNVVAKNDDPSAPVVPTEYDGLYLVNGANLGSTVVWNLPYVAQIGETKYESLQEAIDAVTAGQTQTITFLADINENVTINKNIIIDGDDYKYTGTMTLGAVTATIQNVNFVNGEIVKTAQPISGTFEILDCTFTGETTSGYAIKIGYASSLKIEGCTSTGNSFLYVPYSLANLYVKGVNVENASWAFHLVSIEAPVFENVTITDSYCGIVAQNTGNKVVTLDGCTITATKPLVIWEKQTNNVTFQFKNDNDFGTLAPVWSIVNNNYVSESGSNYDVLKLALDATLKAADGATVVTDLTGYSVKYVDGKYVVKANKVAIGEETYASLAEALAAAKDGDTITFLADITEDVTIKKNIIIDGNKKQYQYAGTMTISGDYDVTIQNVKFVKGYIVQNGSNTIATLTVKGCSFENGGYAVTTERIQNLNVVDCTATNQSLIYAKLTTTNIYVKDVTVTNGNYLAHLVYGSKAYFENVKVVDGPYYGICTQNYGAKTITLKNCEFDAQWPLAVRNDRTSESDTFIFEGTNTMANLENVDNMILKMVVGATLTAPAGLTIDTGSTLNTVAYTNGTYHVVTTVGVEYTNIRFGSSLSLIFAIGGQGKFGLVDGDYVIITPKIADGKGTKLTRGNGLDWTVVTIGNEQYYAVEFSGLAAKQMTDEVSVQIFSKDGVALSPVFTTSIREYAMKRLYAEEAAPEFKTLVINMLNYGAAAQTYFEYNENDLANAGLGQTSGTVTFPDNYVSGEYLLGVSARFANTTSLIFKFSRSMEQEGMKAVFTYTNHYGVECTVDGTISVDDDGNFAVELQALTLSDARQVVTCTIYGADGETITEVQDSIASYCGRPTEEAVMVALAKDYMKFADSSYAYLHPTKK